MELLSNIPKFEDSDPILIPLRDRLLPLKDLEWVDSESFAFEDRESKITQKSSELASAKEQDHLARQSTLYAQNNWELADSEQKAFQVEGQRRQGVEMKQSLARWRKEYCDPSYEKLHAMFAKAGELHREITQLEGCVNVEEQVRLLEETQGAYMEIMQRLDFLTDQLRRRQHELRTAAGYASDDWELITKVDKEKETEDASLVDQRADFKLDKIRLHAQCVKYLIESGIDTLTFHKSSLETELNTVMDSLTQKTTNEELPAEDSADAYPSEELIEQFKESGLALNVLNRCINQLHAQIEATDLNMITEETTPAINKAHKKSDWTVAETLQSQQRTKQQDFLDANSGRLTSRNEANTTFTDRLTKYITAHNGRKEARLAAIVYGPGNLGSGSGDSASATTNLMQEQMKTQMISNMMNPMHMSRMQEINNIGSSNTRYEYVYKYTE